MLTDHSEKKTPAKMKQSTLVLGPKNKKEEDIVGESPNAGQQVESLEEVLSEVPSGGEQQQRGTEQTAQQTATTEKQE